ncbi:hypothetical protein ACP70R_045241 [Stipagrostis hirtigluma subsp. patula]
MQPPSTSARAASMKRKTVELEEGWRFMAASLAKIRRAVDGDGERLSGEEHMLAYATVYDMCNQREPHKYSQQLYQRYKDDLESYIASTVLPPLKEMHGETLLRELLERWTKHNRVVSHGNMLFCYLNRYYVPSRSLPPVDELGPAAFRRLVLKELKSTMTGAMIAMIDDEREGKLIDRDLVKNVLDIFIPVGLGHLDDYQVDFEQAFLEGARDYYSRKAQTWILEYSDSDYMLKVEECLQNEKERVAHFLDSSIEPKLMEAMRSELITKVPRIADVILKNSEGGAT